MGAEVLGKGGRMSHQAAHCEQDSPEHEVGTSQRPLKMLCPQISSSWWQRDGDKIWGVSMLEEDICCRGTVSRSPRSHPSTWRMAGAVVGITSSHCTPA